MNKEMVYWLDNIKDLALDMKEQLPCSVNPEHLDLIVSQVEFIKGKLEDIK